MAGIPGYISQIFHKLNLVSGYPARHTILSINPPESENLRPAERVGDPATDPATTAFRDQYVGDMFTGGQYDFHQGGATVPAERTGDRQTPSGSGYEYHQGGDRVGPPAPERTSDRNSFDTVRDASGQVMAINFGDGTSMRRTGPKEWQAYRGEQPLNPQDLAQFALANALRFPLAVQDGKIIGNITQKEAGGEIQYDCRNTDLNIYATRKPDGSLDVRNYNDYSRTKVGADGQVVDKDYWDGYQWRHGDAVALPTGQVQINFKADEQQPAGTEKPWPRSVVRDRNSDSLTIQHSDQSVMNANWRQQKLTTVRAGQPEDVKMFDGENWRHANEQVIPGGGQSANLVRYEFTDGTGPQAVMIDTTSGEIKEKIGQMDQPTQEQLEQQRQQMEFQRRRQQRTCGPNGCGPRPQCGPQGCSTDGYPQYCVPNCTPCYGGRCG